jgi:acyl-CoA thioesterase
MASTRQRAGAHGEVPGRRSTVTVPPAWWSWSGAQGGVVVGHCVDAMAAALDDEAAVPRSVTAHLLRPVREPLDLEADVLRAGGAVSTAAVVGRVGERLAVRAIGTYGPSRVGPDVAGPPPPAAPPPQDCPVFELPVDFVPIGQQLEIRPTTEARPLAGGPSAELVAWVRLRDDRPLDAAALSILLDALPPGLFATFTEVALVPTVDLTAHFSPAAAAAGRGWVLARITTVEASAGWAVDDSELWSETGERLAVARQARVVVPR